MSKITAVLRSRAENEASDDELMTAVYEELRTMAKVRMANERAGHTLQATGCSIR